MPNPGMSRPLAAALCALTGYASAWALTTLFLRPGWLVDLAVLLLLVAAAGVAGRSWLGASTWVIAGQAVSAVLVLGWLYAGPPGGRSTLALGVLPSPSTLRYWAGLLAEATRTIRENAAPAPSTAGVAFLVVASLTALAVLGDGLACTLSAPAVAGLVLLTPFLAAVANSDGTLPVRFFVLPAVLWLALLAHLESAGLRRWLAATRAALVGRRSLADGSTGSGRGQLTVALAGTATLLAVLGAGMLPTLPVRYLADGLGRGGGGDVTFSEDLDLLADLADPSDAPVLTYRTTDPNPPPLRVTVAEQYREGRWTPASPEVTPSRSPQLSPPPGLSELTPRTAMTLTVETTALAAPHLAVPYPLEGWGEVTDALWAVDPNTGIAVTDRTPRSYSMRYLSVTPERTELERSSWALTPPSPRTVQLDPTSEEVARRYLPSIRPEGASPYQTAVAIQDWLTSDRFSYSLQPVPAPPGTSTAEAERTALARFLQTRRGYCVQFASTMAVLARAEGIPARVVSGFLPGLKRGDTWEVRVSDAHAWPELFFPGVGWLRFEPTPAVRSGTPPPYSTAVTGRPTTTSAATPDEASPSSRPTATGRDPADRDRDQSQAAAQADEQSPIAPGLLWGLAALAAALSAMPVLAWTVRRHRVRSSPGDADRVEAQWEDLVSRLGDLGLRAPSTATLAEQHRYYRERSGLSDQPDAALGRVCTAVQLARYAPDPDLPEPSQLHADAVTVRRAVGRSRPVPARLGAALWPSAARAAVTGAARRLAGALRAVLSTDRFGGRRQQ